MLPLRIAKKLCYPNLLYLLSLVEMGLFEIKVDKRIMVFCLEIIVCSYPSHLDLSGEVIMIWFRHYVYAFPQSVQLT